MKSESLLQPNNCIFKLYFNRQSFGMPIAIWGYKIMIITPAVGEKEPFTLYSTYKFIYKTKKTNSKNNPHHTIILLIKTNNIETI